MKNVTLIGASGYVGSAILNGLLNRGYKVTAFVRDPLKIVVKNDNLKVVGGDVTDTEALIDVCKGKDAVISAYNPGWSNPNIVEDTLRNYPMIVDSVKRAGVKRLQIVGGAGTLFCAPGVRVVDSGAIPDSILGLLSTHTGRKTFICKALALGIPVNVVMQWTGHSDYNAMKPYIAVADSIRASNMSRKSVFAYI